MPLQASGQISISNIVGELYGTFPAADSNRSLTTLTAAANNSDACNTASLPGSNAAPHAMSEFYSYDHSCTSGPTLLTCSIVGPYGAPEEACALGPEECAGSYPVYTDGASCCPELTNTYYTNSAGTIPLASGWYYACDCESPYTFFTDDSGVIIDSMSCGK